MSNDVLFSEHSTDMLKERKFTKEFIIDIVSNPDNKEIAEGDIWYAFRKVGQKVIRVVVKGR